MAVWIWTFLIHRLSSGFSLLNRNSGGSNSSSPTHRKQRVTLRKRRGVTVWRKCWHVSEMLRISPRSGVRWEVRSQSREAKMRWRSSGGRVRMVGWEEEDIVIAVLFDITALVTYSTSFSVDVVVFDVSRRLMEGDILELPCLFRHTPILYRSGGAE